jgi:hypothetical protein
MKLKHCSNLLKLAPSLWLNSQPDGVSNRVCFRKLVQSACITCSFPPFGTRTLRHLHHTWPYRCSFPSLPSMQLGLVTGLTCGQWDMNKQAWKEITHFPLLSFAPSITRKWRWKEQTHQLHIKDSSNAVNVCQPGLYSLIFERIINLRYIRHCIL